MTKLVAIAVLVLAVAAIAFFLPRNPTVQLSTPSGATLQCEVASTSQAREAGLSNYSYLCPDCCMLFSFETLDFRGFWMKDMQFPLDIVFLDASYSVVDSWENASPCTPQECPIHYPKRAAKYVVEVNAGKAAELGLANGAQITGAG